MKKIYIHAGPGKTGTSTIQHWLSRNVDLLAENTEVTAIVNGVCSMNIEHLSDLNIGFMEYIGYFQQQNTDDLYI